MQIPMEKATEWIRSQARTHPVFMIRKHEYHDVDEVRMRIDEIELSRNAFADVDDYVAKQALLLRGEGAFVGQIDAPLPEDTYEIALAEPCLIEQEGSSLRITTHRATYTVTPESAAPIVH